MNKIKVPLLSLVVLFSLCILPTQQKGKTYEDLAEVIKNANTQG